MEGVLLKVQLEGKLSLKASELVKNVLCNTEAWLGTRQARGDSKPPGVWKTEKRMWMPPLGLAEESACCPPPSHLTHTPYGTPTPTAPWRGTWPWRGWLTTPATPHVPQPWPPALALLLPGLPPALASCSSCLHAAAASSPPTCFPGPFEDQKEKRGPLRLAVLPAPFCLGRQGTHSTH